MGICIPAGPSSHAARRSRFHWNGARRRKWPLKKHWKFRPLLFFASIGRNHGRINEEQELKVKLIISSRMVHDVCKLQQVDGLCNWCSDTGGTRRKWGAERMRAGCWRHVPFISACGRLSSGYLWVGMARAGMVFFCLQVYEGSRVVQKGCQNHCRDEESDGWQKLHCPS